MFLGEGVDVLHDNFGRSLDREHALNELLDVVDNNLQATLGGLFVGQWRDFDLKDVRPSSHV
jgi:hypothetical protein